MVDVVVARPAVTMAAGRPPPAVEIRQLSLVFAAGDAAVTALADVDLTVDPGDFVSPIGPGGCGKTALLRAMADLERASSGEVRVNGVRPDTAPLARAYGYVLQAPALCLAHGCCATSPCRWRSWRWRRPSGSRAACSSSSTSAALSANFPGSFPAACSSGCPSPARFCVDPALLLMDEPFGRARRDHPPEQNLR
jgi:NitT/TauT family transport system ATP-binding protein